ncbi:hypothetical protein C8Q75DRAFT_705133, partial [Abortiporus biennis]
HLILHFVPINGTFDPQNTDDLRFLEDYVGAPQNSISKAYWIKNPEKCAPGQRVANVKLILNNRKAANTFLNVRLYIDESLVAIAKDRKESLRCMNCQQFGHIQATYTQTQRCACCALQGHGISDCPRENPAACVSCNGGNHPSNSRDCPAFVSQCRVFDTKYPENSMHYFPTLENWTWA